MHNYVMHNYDSAVYVMARYLFGRPSVKTAKPIQLFFGTEATFDVLRYIIVVVYYIFAVVRPNYCYITRHRVSTGTR